MGNLRPVIRDQHDLHAPVLSAFGRDRIPQALFTETNSVQPRGVDPVTRNEIRLHRVRAAFTALGAREQVVHELVVEAPAEEAQAVRELLVDVMESAMTLDVPTVADASIGANWAECK